jgi:hypothetical protein
MGAPSVDIKDVLVTASVGTFASTSGWSIRISKEPTSPDSTITVYDTGGFEPSAKWLLDFPTVQVRVRGDKLDYVAAYAKIQAVKDALLGLPRQTVNGTVYVGVWQEGDIFSLGYDDTDRPLLISNFRIAREPASGTNRASL